ncbi:type VI secretion system tube protein Hcp [Vannielia sp.]|uniref:Hcp family type VI secretion system effector n=1 Tax=Vannielia sp. TaxID=2813045 RepID=UPI0026273A9D|nr:type VI secretion system tube protein Hcp [Vannielia sp.]MDF1872438.1 type VI secretion system tube protein Hcp [Vannielia sp.]
MATALYMKLDGVDGECVVKGYEGWIDLMSMSFAGSQSGTMHTGRGGGSGKVQVGDLMATKVCDKCSTDLLKKLCLGQHYATVDVHATKATGGEVLPYFTVKLTHAIVTSMSFGGAGGGDDVMTESFSLNYREIDVEYKLQNEDGTDAGTTTAGYNVATGEGR